MGEESGSTGAAAPAPAGPRTDPGGTGEAAGRPPAPKAQADRDLERDRKRRTESAIAVLKSVRRTGWWWPGE